MCGEAVFERTSSLSPTFLSLTVFLERVIRCANLIRVLVTRFCVSRILCDSWLPVFVTAFFVLILTGILEIMFEFEAPGSGNTDKPGNHQNPFIGIRATIILRLDLR